LENGNAHYINDNVILIFISSKGKRRVVSFAHFVLATESLAMHYTFQFERKQTSFLPLETLRVCKKESV